MFYLHVSILPGESRAHAGSSPNAVAEGRNRRQPHLMPCSLRLWSRVTRCDLPQSDLPGPRLYASIGRRFLPAIKLLSAW